MGGITEFVSYGVKIGRSKMPRQKPRLRHGMAIITRRTSTWVSYGVWEREMEYEYEGLCNDAYMFAREGQPVRFDYYPLDLLGDVITCPRCLKHWNKIMEKENELDRLEKEE